MTIVQIVKQGDYSDRGIRRQSIFLKIRFASTYACLSSHGMFVRMAPSLHGSLFLALSQSQKHALAPHHVHIASFCGRHWLCVGSWSLSTGVTCTYGGTCWNTQGSEHAIYVWVYMCLCIENVQWCPRELSSHLHTASRMTAVGAATS